MYIWTEIDEIFLVSHSLTNKTKISSLSKNIKILSIEISYILKNKTAYLTTTTVTNKALPAKVSTLQTTTLKKVTSATKKIIPTSRSTLILTTSNDITSEINGSNSFKIPYFISIFAFLFASLI